MRVIFERYWALASDLDNEAKEAKELRGRKKFQYNYLKKGEVEYKLMDKILQILDKVASEEKPLSPV